MSAVASPASPAPVRVLGRFPVHPALVAVWPALAMWASNVGEVLPSEVWPAVWLPVVCTAGVWALAGALLRSARRGAIVASVAAGAFLNAGRVFGGDPGILAVVVTVLLVVAAVVAAWRMGPDLRAPVTAVLNVMAVTLVLLAVPPVLTTWGPGGGVATAAPIEGGNALAGRDIWYIVPDRYPRADTLEQVFDADNDEFISWLEDRGFQVAERSLANYPKTAHSLAATWNLAPVDELIPDPPEDGSDWGPLYDLLRDHRLGQILTDVGYEYVHLGTWWSPTAKAATADRVLRADTASEFVGVWQSQTLVPALTGGGEDGDDGEDLSLRERNRRYSSYQLDQLDRLARERPRDPRFVLTHITLPHEPYVFDADGSYVTREQAIARGRNQDILNQITYLNSRLKALIAELTDGPPETWPVIVIQSDEGPHPQARTGPEYDWTTAPDEVLAEKLRTFSAILLPQSDVELPEDLTGVNTWRYVLDATIGTEFGPIPDPPIEVFPGEDHLYDLHDVSDRVS